MLYQLIKKDLHSRYRGTLFGFFWAILLPLITLVMYTFVFNVVLGAKWGIENEKTFDFALMLFTGLILHAMLSDIITQAPNLIQSNPQLVKKIVFPTEKLPVVVLLNSLIHNSISLIILLLAIVVIKQELFFTWLLIPILWLPFLVLLIGVAWFLAAFGVFIKDISQISGSLSMFLLFMSPIFYPLSRLPENWHNWMYLNPLTFMIEQSRQIILYGNQPDWLGWAIYLMVAVSITALGYKVFGKLKRGFADAI
ncbi:ABC transporter permease [Thiomicrorhabdus indica]|uniref:ABC transporter permease n=1 Tax=Thiomicrorhabdus indica TaxID=2267253 RepID=UPI00102E0838|nr:ABC transporter permease [Thiomicrorhabdus indica]